MIAVGGENLIDYVKNPGGDVGHSGGSPFNVAMGLGQLGLEVAYLSPISTDAWGDQLYGRITKMGVQHRGGRVPEPSSMAIVSVEDGAPSYDFQRTGTAERAISVEGLAAAMPEDIRALHVGSLAFGDAPDADIWVEVVKGAVERGVIFATDPNVRLQIIEDPAAYRARMMEVLPRAHIVKFSDEDVEGLFPGLGLADGVQALRDLVTAPVVILTKGAEGGHVWHPQTEFAFDVQPVPQLVDTVGAGDTFMANVIGWLAREDKLSVAALETLRAPELRAMILQATTAAALNCATEGCNPPTQAEIDRILG